ncbi:MAG: glucohydrolase, partial [Rhodospirillales bacterium]|nr:glucohydrolase [Acetobacter sp.]
NGGIVMLNRDDQDVLSWVRTAPAGAQPVVVAMNMSASPKTISLNLNDAGVNGNKARTLAASDPSLQNITAFQSVTLPPFSSWVASVQ